MSIKINELDLLGNFVTGDTFVGERVDGTTVRITFNGTDITTVGTIATGTWQGTAIDAAYISDAFLLNTGDSGVGSYSLTGNADAVQLTVKGNATQTSDIFQILKSDNTELLAIDNSGNVSVGGTVDGRDLATDGTKLDGVEALADVTDETNVKAALDGATITAVTPLANDRILLLDDSDTNNLKIGLYSDFSSGDWELVGSSTASSNATIDFTGLSSTYIAYQVIYTGIVPATDNTSLLLRVGTGGTPTYVSSSSYTWSYAFNTDGGTSGFFQSAGDTSILLASGAGSSTGENVCGKLMVYNPSQGSVYHLVSFENAFFNNAPVSVFYNGQGCYESATAVTAIRFLMSSGNIASGEFRLFGLKGS